MNDDDKYKLVEGVDGEEFIKEVNATAKKGYKHAGSHSILDWEMKSSSLSRYSLLMFKDDE